MRMKKIGLILNIVGVVILGFQPNFTLWDSGMKPKFAILNILGWACLGVGFLFQLFANENKK
jgi:hypothetical protein